MFEVFEQAFESIALNDIIATTTIEESDKGSVACLLRMKKIRQKFQGIHCACIGTS